MTPATKRATTAVVAFVVGVIALNVLARGLDDAVGGREPGGEAGSSYATSASGFAAYADLLARWGHPVERQRGELAAGDLDPSTTVVVGGRDGVYLTASEVSLLRAFVADGGRLVLAASGTFPRNVLVDRTFETAPGRDRYHEISHALGEVREVVSDGSAAFASDAGTGADWVVSDGDRALAGAVAQGRGLVVVVAEPSPLENRGLAEADNAAFAVELAGADGRPVVFAEGVHGHDTASGFAAIPSQWKVALFGVAAAAVVFAWARARRLGPPDRPHRDLPPARAAYIDALATTLERTREPAAALADMATAARERVERESIVVADHDLATLTTPPKTDDDVLTLGRVAARIACVGTDGRTSP